MFKILLLLSLTFSLGMFGQDSLKDIGTKLAWYQSSKTVNENIVNERKQGKLYFIFSVDSVPNAALKGHFDWLTDYPQAYFTAHFVNLTDSVVNIERQDGSFMMIQEAMNQKGEWEAIEHWMFSWCGNSYFNPLVLEPGQNVMVPIKKYKGDYKTRVRLKLKMGDDYFYSNSFVIEISEAQFRSFDMIEDDKTFKGSSNYFDD